MPRARSVLVSVFSTLFALAPVPRTARAADARVAQPAIGTSVVGTLQADGALFKDLNKNGEAGPLRGLAPPRGRARGRPRLADDARGEGGPHGRPFAGDGPRRHGARAAGLSGRTRSRAGRPALVSPGTTDAIHKRHIVQFINRENTDPRTMATWTNAVQQVAEGRRLGTPVLFVTNPRNHYGAGATFGIAEASGAFSQWPGTLGLAATRDPALVEEFARIAAQEYVSVGTGARTTRRPTSRPSRGGDASGRRSARTPTSRRS